MNNTLKLVYDNWENYEPKPNGYVNNIGLTSSLFYIPYEVIRIMESNNYKVQSLKLEEADSNSYFIINHQCSFEFLFGKSKWIIPESVEEVIRTKNLKVIFLSEHESFNDIEIHLSNLKKLIHNKNLKEENFYVLNNNSFLYQAKEVLNTKINLFKTNWLIEILSQFNTTDIQFIPNKKFIFLLHNRLPKPHRTGLLILLKKIGLLDSGLIDWSLVYPMVGHPFTDTMFMDKTFINIHSKELRPIYKNFLTTQKLSYYETDKDWFVDTRQLNGRKYNEVKSFEESYINIVTESYFDETNIHISEKTFRPFHCLQLPLFLANYKHISKLREEHPSLHLFDDLIDHSYDNEKDNSKRLEKVVEEIKRLSEMKDTIAEYYVNNKSKIIENRNYIESFSNNKTTFEFFKSLADG